MNIRTNLRHAKKRIAERSEDQPKHSNKIAMWALTISVLSATFTGLQFLVAWQQQKDSAAVQHPVLLASNRILDAEFDPNNQSLLVSISSGGVRAVHTEVITAGGFIISAPDGSGLLTPEIPIIDFFTVCDDGLVRESNIVSICYGDNNFATTERYRDQLENRNDPEVLLHFAGVRNYLKVSYTDLANRDWTDYIVVSDYGMLDEPNAQRTFEKLRLLSDANLYLSINSDFREISSVLARYLGPLTVPVEQ